MDPRYIYISARIRALETRFLDKLKLERMIAATSPKASLAELEETDYGPAVSQLKDINNFRELLYDESKQLYAFIDKWSLDKELTALFRMRYDFHNLKVFLKNKLKEKPLPLEELPFIDLGTINPLKIGEAGKFPLAPKEVMKTFEKKKDPQDIDIILDKEYYRICISKARNTKNEFVINLFRIEIDLINIKTFFRCRTLKKKSSFFFKVFIEGGSLSKSSLLPFYQKEESAFLKKLSFTDYSKIISRYKKEGLRGLELACDNFFLQYVKKTKLITAGVEVLVAYLLAKENEIKLLRSILLGKINEIPARMISERLRETFI